MVDQQHFQWNSDEQAQDVNSLAAALVGWNQEYDQVDVGAFKGSLNSVQLEGIELFREQLNITVSQQATTPSHRISLFVPLSLQDDGKTTDQSRCIAYDGLTLLPYESDVYWVSPAHADYAMIAFDQDYLQPLLSDADFAALMSVQRTHAAQLSSSHLTILQNNLRQLLNPNQSLLLDERQFSHSLVDVLLDLTANRNQGEQRWKPLGNQHLYIVRQSLAYALSSEGSAASVLDLCKILNIPRRTLNYSFEKVTGIAPSKYLRYIRLNQIRRALLGSDEPIGDIAARYGFSHQAYFGKEYRVLFGETPSATRQKKRLW
ncbi:helix-turn-helix domain-containing protein [Oceanobacter mangrovi]|uniref:helix-turn-helix domain-containing protein n=1 Tax=Oceanobacter mangrovi TaxID=2862510 RepID=UPI001C8DF5B7|nr:helix-turn-helix domain-containing protein [Oceanobacter mangrovi]